MILIFILLLAICESARVPINMMIRATPINSGKLTFQTPSPKQLSLVQPEYFLYNILQVDSNRPISLIHFPYEKPGNSYVTSSLNYYGTPLYAYEIHYVPYFPGVPPMIPNYVPQQKPMVPMIPSSTTPEIPQHSDEDNIEKLDEKIDPNLEMNTNNDHSKQDDDSVVVDAID